MSDQPARQYAEDGSFADSMCECKWWTWHPDFPVRSWEHDSEDEDEWEDAQFEAFICRHCGSFCDASGYATPGTLVLWEAHRRLARDLIRTDAAHYQCTGSALIPLIGIATSEDEIQRANTAAANACAEARATLAAREGA